MARLEKTIKLKRPFESGGGTVTKVVVREPTGAEFFQLGVPRNWIRVPGGAALSDNDEAIKAYVERCIVEPDPLLAMAQMSVIDAMAVREAILSFFQDETTTTSE